jgi:hypothetical protein
MFRERNYPAHHHHDEKYYFTREQVIAMNLKFAAAMLSARKAGAERFTIGIIKDDTPLVPTQFFRAMQRSMSGSSAALLADEVGLMEFHRSSGRAGR